MFECNTAFWHFVVKVNVKETENEKKNICRIYGGGYAVFGCGMQR